MSRTVRAAAALLVCAGAAGAAEAPLAAEETLHYLINWPSGLSLGEGEMSAKLVQSEGQAAQWQFELKMDAAVPGFPVEDKFRSAATAGLCSLEFSKYALHGKRKAEEKTVFDASAGIATRQTSGGGKSELPISRCPRDALTFLYFLRHELNEGRLPAPQTIFFGAPYEISLHYVGTKQVQIGETRYTADQIAAKVKGPASEHSFELLLARDETRRPLRITVPLELGRFTMELAP
jgi:hypothetical protein